MRRRWVSASAGALVLGVTLAGAMFALAQQGRSQGHGWIDQPLAWEAVGVSEYEVQAHVTDPAGVVAARFDVNGATTGERSLNGDTIAVVEFIWVPPGPGVYLLEVYGRNPGGAWGTPGVVTVRVGPGSDLPTQPVDDTPPGTTEPGTTVPSTVPGTSMPGTTTTLAPTTTGPATTTTAPATTTTLCAFPAPVAGAVTAGRTQGFYTFNWSYSGCTAVPFSFLIHLSRENTFPTQRTDSYLAAGGVRSTVIQIQPCLGDYFWRIRVVDPDGNPLSPWSTTASFSCG